MVLGYSLNARHAIAGKNTGQVSLETSCVRSMTIKILVYDNMNDGNVCVTTLS